MSELKMGNVEAKFAAIIWENEPIASGELARMAENRLGWKKTTSFTVLKRLCEKGIFQNEQGKVTSRIGREQYYALQSEQFVSETFDGSLPAFLAAFTTRQRLTEEEIGDLRRMIEEYDGKAGKD